MKTVKCDRNGCNRRVRKDYGPRPLCWRCWNPTAGKLTGADYKPGERPVPTAMV